MPDPENITEYMRENYRDQLSEEGIEEDISTIAEAVRIAGEQRAHNLRRENELTMEDMKWALSWYCLLPLWPKPDDEESQAEAIRSAILDGMSEQRLPVPISSGIFRLNHPTLLDIRVESSQNKPSISLRSMISEQSLESVSEQIRQGELH
jgi:hypothetical protein